VVICLERGADLHMAQLMPLPLTVSCFSKIQIGFTFPVVPDKRPLNVCVYVSTDRMLFLLPNYQVQNTGGNTFTFTFTLPNRENTQHTQRWWRSTVVERRSVTGELSLSCARPAADG